MNSSNFWLFVGTGVVWSVIAIAMLSLQRGQRKLRSDIEVIRTRK